MHSVIYNNFVVKEESKSSRYLQMDAILKRLFTIENTIPIIDFLNAAYKDNLSYDCKIIYTNTEIINNENDIRGDIMSSGLGYIIHHSDLYITAYDKGRRFEYAVEFQTKFDETMGIRMFRYGFERAAKIHKTISKSKVIIEFPQPYLILLEEENEVEDLISLEVIFPKGEKANFNIDVLKYWNYDVHRLYIENMYLLYPLQIFKLRKDMERISKSKERQKSKTVLLKKLHSKLIMLIKDSNQAIDKALQDDKIDIRTCNEMVTALANLNAYLIDVYELPDEIEKETEKLIIFLGSMRNTRR